MPPPMISCLHSSDALTIKALHLFTLVHTCSGHLFWSLVLAFEFVLSAARENDRFTFFGVSLIDWKPVLATCLACSYG